MIERLCDAVVARLKARIAKFEVDHYPDVPDRFPWSKARETLLVTYDGEQYADAASLVPLSTPGRVEFSVVVLVKSLRGGLGATATLEAVRNALMGWEPNEPGENEGDEPVWFGFGPCMPVRAGFVSEDQGTWRFVIVFSTTRVVVAESEELGGAPFQRATFKEATPS